MKKLYVGCSLAHATLEFREEIEHLKQQLRKKYTVFEFVPVDKGTIKEVFENDERCVRECDLFVAECSHPSIGLGIEIGLAISQKKPILAVAKTDAIVSRMLQGIPAKNFTFMRYNSIEEILEAVDKTIAILT